jgi:uracil-DNA glycosylase
MRSTAAVGGTSSNAASVALGATAARSLAGKVVTIAKVRGQVLPLDDVSRLMVTIHPSFLLRIPDQEGRHAEYAHFVEDLRLCGAFLR